MSIQLFRNIEQQREKMIKTAKECFETANNVILINNIILF